MSFAKATRAERLELMPAADVRGIDRKAALYIAGLVAVPWKNALVKDFGHQGAPRDYNT